MVFEVSFVARWSSALMKVMIVRRMSGGRRSSMDDILMRWASSLSVVTYAR